MNIHFTINGIKASVDVDPLMPLLWVVRDELGLKATKYGCGKALCGACTLHVDGEAMRSCSFPVSAAAGKVVTTLEGLSVSEGEPEEILHPVQQAWIDEQVPQCGYCQPGFMMAAAKFIVDNPNPTDDDITSSITNICRCGTQPRIIKAIKRAAELHRTSAKLSSNSPPKSPYADDRKTV
jgi:isoquinoline 1-oxidoreductase subunit alpha